MTETPKLSIYEKTFAKSDKTDAILVVDGKKLHVNKALLSYHSDYFNVLFNSEFKEKSMEEIEIKDVDFEDFAVLLSLFDEKPLEITKENAENLLELADRFLLSNARVHVESFMKNSTEFRRYKQMMLEEENMNRLDEPLLLFYDKYYFPKKLEKNQRLFPESVTSDLFRHPEENSTEFRDRHKHGDEVLNITDDRLSFYGSEKLEKNRNRNRSNQRLFPESVTSDLFRHPEKNSIEFRDRHKHGDEILNITDDRLSFYGSEKLAKRNKNESNQRLFPDSFFSDRSYFRPPEENPTEFRRRNRLNMMEDELMNRFNNKNGSNQRLFPESDFFKYRE
ncbi:unnamed protein product [Caenorhabditis brenneri]